MDYIKNRLKESSTWLGLISVIASLIMVFTPDNIDMMIEKILPYFKELVELLFAAWGITKIAMPDKK